MRIETTLPVYFGFKPPKPLWQKVAEECKADRITREALQHMAAVIAKGGEPLGTEIGTYRRFHLHVKNTTELSNALQRLRLKIQGPANQ